MKKTPLISVIVPIYKVEPYLDRCVESIVNQTYENLEIILVDDGSPDNCPAMCDAWAEKDSRIRVIHKENGGLSDARNAGMAVASGEYIAFVDSDDLVDRSFLSLLHASAIEHSAALAACDVLPFFSEDALRHADPDTTSTVHTPEEALADLLRGRRFRAVVWNKLYHRDLLTGEYFEVGKLREDEFFTYRILDKAERLAYTDAPLYLYRQRPGSIMATVSLRHLDVLDAYLNRLAFLRLNYPALFTRDKVTFCKSCVHFYRAGLKSTQADAKQYFSKIKAARKKIRFSLQDFRRYSLKDSLFVIGSGLPIAVFARLLNGLGRDKE